MALQKKTALANVPCDGCGEDFECPKPMLGTGLNYCMVCEELLDQGVGKKNLAKEHRLRGDEIKAEFLREDIAGTFTDQSFPRLWKKEKHLFEQLDLENIAWEAYCAGTQAILEHTTKNPNKKETLETLKKLKETVERC